MSMKKTIEKVCVWLFIFSQAGIFAWAKTVYDLQAEIRLIEELASPDSDTKINAAVEIGKIFRNQQGLHPQVYSKLLKMLSPKSSHAEREGAAWALGEIRYVDPATRKLMEQYEEEAIKSGDIALSTILMHSLREVADVWPDSKKRKCSKILRNIE